MKGKKTTEVFQKSFKGVQSVETSQSITFSLIYIGTCVVCKAMNCNPQFYILKLKWIRILGNQNFLKNCSKAWEFELLGRFAENCMMHSCSLQSLMHALPFLVLEINNIMLQFLSFSELHMNHLEIIAAKVFYEIPELLHLWVFILRDRKFWNEAETTSFLFRLEDSLFLKNYF